MKNPFSRPGAEARPVSSAPPALEAASADPRPDVGRPVGEPVAGTGRAGAADAADAADALEGAEATDFPAPVDGEERRVALEIELARARDAWRRAEADLQTFRRRGARELEEAERRGADGALLRLLTFADDLERALRAAEEAGEKDSALAQGVALVLHRLLESLRAQGVTPIDPVGLEFDPREHEALLTAPSATQAAGRVAQVIAKGWRQGDRLIRPARVLVSSGPGGA